MKHVYCLLVFFVFVVSNLNAQKFSVPESYSIEKNPKITCPMECVGYKEDSLVFYCRKEKKYYIRRSDNYFQFNVIVPNLGKFEYVELEEILNDKIIWKAYCERDDSVKFICLNGENVLFEYTSNISHEENSYKAGFFNGGRSVYIKKFYNPWHDYGNIDPILYFADLGMPMKKMEIKSSLNAIAFGTLLYYSKRMNYFYDDERNEYETMDIHCIDGDGVDRIIAKDSELLMVSCDGKYLLANKKLYGKSVPIIIDLDKNKCVYLLGQKYRSRYFYYDVEKNAFCYDMGDKIQCFPCDSKKFIYDPKVEFSIYKSDCDKFWESH